jgi:hypothetical protein
MRIPLAAPRARYHLGIASRAFAAGAGGYLLACACSVGMGLAFLAGGMTPVDALIVANGLAFIAYASAVLWAFSCANAARAWWGILGPALLLAALGVSLQGHHP